MAPACPERLSEEEAVFVLRSPAEVERLLASAKKFPQTLTNR